MHSKTLINPTAKIITEHVSNNTLGEDAVVTVNAKPEQFWAIGRIDWSYSNATAGGKLTVAYAGSTVWEIDIVAAGPGHVEFKFPDFLHNDFTKNQQLVVTLHHGGGNATKKLNVRYC